MVKTLPQSIDIWMASINGNGQFSIPVLQNLSSNDNQTMWTVSANNDGQYKMRIGISGRDPLLNTASCLQNGTLSSSRLADFFLQERHMVLLRQHLKLSML